MVPAVRARLQVEARGNPRALVELPRGLSRAQHMAIQALPRVLPLGKRLQATFRACINELPAETRQSPHGAGDARRPANPTLTDLQGPRSRDTRSCRRRRGVGVDQSTGRVEFRHPLISSAVIESSTGDERRRTHRELATLLADQPDPSAWHLAAATVGPDEHVAGLFRTRLRSGSSDEATPSLGLRPCCARPT